MRVRRPAVICFFLLILLTACQPAPTGTLATATGTGNAPIIVEIIVPTSENQTQNVVAIATQTTPTLEPTPSLIPSPTLAPTGTLTPATAVVTFATPTSALTPDNMIETVAAPSPTLSVGWPEPTPVGISYGGRTIVDYQLGQGPRQIVLVGGMHGGYEWNTISLAYDLFDYFVAHPELIPQTITMHIIPSANPDGQYAATGKEGRFSVSDVYIDTVPGRFNGRAVDLNRNWDCSWQPTATWRGNEVSPGAAPFSEPETSALRAYLTTLDPAVVVFYHSAANGVFAAGCPDVHQPSMDLAAIYGSASGYPIYERFFHYEVNGDASDYLSTLNIPSFSVELITHEGLDWQMNLNGVKALLASYAAGE